MNISQRVVCDLYENYGGGTIISQRKLFGRTSYSVFFESVGKSIELYEDDLKGIGTPLEMFNSGLLSTAIEFKLNFLAYAIDASTSGEKPMSAASFKIMPLPHQILALDRVVNRFRPRYLLADEVGLGKTIEAALIMEELKLRNIVNRVLIITPAGLTRQWQEEMKLKFDEDFSIFSSGTFRSFKELYGKDTNIWENFDHVITSMDFLKPKKISDGLKEKEKARREWHNAEVFQDCVNAGWDMAIIDEAHKLSKYQRGEETARYKLGKSISESVPIFLIVTATPHRGKSDLFMNLLKLVDPYLFNNYDALTPENVKKVTVRNKKRATVDFNGNLLFKDRITTLCKIERTESEDEPEIKLYNAVTEYVSEYYNYAREENNYLLIFLLMLYQRIVSSSSKAILKSLNRRHKTLTSTVKLIKEVMDTPRDEFYELPGEERIQILEKIGPVLKNPDRVKKEIGIVSNCIDLAKNAIVGRNDAKLRSLMSIIDEIKRKENDKDVKFLIFTEFIETQKYIVDSLERLGYTTAIINGSMSLDEKIRQKKMFRKGAQIMVSTDAGGEGINLQFCHVVINYDLPWNPMQIEQRIGRVDRIGQEKDVIVSNFILADTVEENVRDKIETKLHLVREQFGEDKFSDILSTLNEDFKFDKVYMDFIAKKTRSDSEIEDVSNDIYQKAVEILENDEMLVPFTDKNRKSPLEFEDIKHIASRVRLFTDMFLKTRGKTLNEYKEDERLYYFDNDFRTDLFPRHFGKAIFEQSMGMEVEDSTLLSFNHPYIRHAIQNSKDSGKVASITIQSQKFAGTSGYLFNWNLIISNNFDMHQEIMMPVFITEECTFNRRISEYLKNMDNYEMTDSSNNVVFDISGQYSTAEATVRQISENIFLERESHWKSKVEEEHEKMKKYYEQRRDAVRQIAIDNIRDGKLKEMRREQHKKTIEMDKRKQLFPELVCTQIARIEFKWNE